MIVEAAFFTLPEVLCSNYDHASFSEAAVVSGFYSALFLQLVGRGVSQPFEHLLMEMPYPKGPKSGQRLRADLWIDSRGLGGRAAGRILDYGVRENTWIEVAVPGESRDGKSAPTSRFYRKLLRDILRVCLLPEEHRGKIRQNARYLLIVGRQPITRGLRKTDLQRLMSGDGSHEFQLEVPTKVAAKVKLSLGITCQTFSPVRDHGRPGFFGHLMRIDTFALAAGSTRIDYVAEKGWCWTELDENAKQTMCDLVFSRQPQHAT